MKKLGANEVIDYTTQNVLKTLESTASSTQEYDLIVDCVGGMELIGSHVSLERTPQVTAITPLPSSATNHMHNVATTSSS